jgi:hypothetical protein
VRKPNGGEEEKEVASGFYSIKKVCHRHNKVCRTKFGVRAALKPFGDFEVTFEGGSNALV